MVDPSHLAASVEPAAELIRAGRLVAFATETVYGLGADAFDPVAVRSIFAAKGRPPDDPLIVHVLPQWPLEQVFASVSPIAQLLVDRLWPGPLTIVGPKAAGVPDLVTSGLPDVAVRAPSHPVAQALLAAAGRPIAAPSANRFSYVSATTADHVIDDLGDSVDAVLDSGPATAGIESTVVRVNGTVLEVLRHGALSTADILAAVPELTSAIDPPARSSAASPGQLITHYSPTTGTVALRAGATLPSEFAAGSRRVVVLGYDRPATSGLIETRSLGSRDDLDGVARTLYAKLRSADEAGADLIVVELTGADGIGRALDDRITRAASGVVIPTANDAEHDPSR